MDADLIPETAAVDRKKATGSGQEKSRSRNPGPANPQPGPREAFNGKGRPFSIVKEQMTRGQVLQNHLFAGNRKMGNIPKNQNPDRFLGAPIGGRKNENPNAKEKTEISGQDS